jgi:hypothetical protein
MLLLFPILPSTTTAMAFRQHNAKSKVLPRLQQQRLPFQSPHRRPSPSTRSRTVHTRDSTPTSEFELNDEILTEPSNGMENIQGSLLAPDSQSQTSDSSKKLKRKRTCWVFRHMRGTDDMQKVFFNEDGREIWPCKHCNWKYIIAGGTLNIEKHLWGKHKVFEESPMESKLKNQQLSIQESMASSEANLSSAESLLKTHLTKRLWMPELWSLFM